MEAMDDVYMPLPPIYEVEHNGEDSGIDSDSEERNLCYAMAYDEEATDCVYCENASYEEVPDTDRDSPALFEVELTATEEEDDGSVLELVIPTQPKRGKFEYQRLARCEHSTADNPVANVPYWVRFACCLFVGK